MDAMIIFWAIVAAYEVAVAVKFFLLPALHRREARRIGRMNASERREYSKYINY